MIMFMSILLTCQTDKLIAAYWLVMCLTAIQQERK